MPKKSTFASIRPAVHSPEPVQKSRKIHHSSSYRYSLLIPRLKLDHKKQFSSLIVKPYYKFVVKTQLTPKFIHIHTLVLGNALRLRNTHIVYIIYLKRTGMTRGDEIHINKFIHKGAFAGMWLLPTVVPASLGFYYTEEEIPSPRTKNIMILSFFPSFFQISLPFIYAR